MSEWASLLLVYWLLWALEGWRLPTVPRFGVAGGRRGARLVFSRLLPPVWWPTSWSATTADIPFSFSPAGIANRPAGAAGRPTDAPDAASAWSWGEIKTVTAKNGWLEINSRRFCRDTGHLSARQLLELAQLPEAARASKLEWWLRRWLRPAHLRRRARVLRARTDLAATANVLSLLLMLVISGYLFGGVAHRLPPRWADFAASLLWLWVLYLAFLHLLAVGAAAWATRRLRPVAPHKRGSSLFTALLLPPQALRLRATLAEGWFPAQHPLAYALAFAQPAQREEIAFDTLADLRWPVHVERDAALAQEIAAWFRTALAREFAPLLSAVKLEEATLLAPPAPDSATSQRYCPRCGCQFSTARERCPQGIELQPLAEPKHLE